MKTVKSSRLRELREHSGLNQSELAKLLGIHTSQLSRWEKGERQPSLEQKISLARALGVTLDYLLNAELSVHFQFRSKKSYTKEERSEIDKALVEAEMQVHYLNSAYKLSEKLPQPFTYKMDFFQQQLPTLAQRLREVLKLNQRITLEEFKQALTELNVHIFEWLLPWDLSGLSYRGAFAVIFINRLHTKERRLFTLAHEFAHILFHTGRDNQQTVVSTISSNRDPIEKEAYAFASEFLMPTDTVDKILSVPGAKLKSIEVLDSIARYFNVSREAIFYRLVEKGIFSWEEKKFYFSKQKSLPIVPPTRVENIDEQVACDFLRMALELFDAEKISSGKLQDWFFTDLITLDEYLANRVVLSEEVFEF